MFGTLEDEDLATRIHGQGSTVEGLGDHFFANQHAHVADFFALGFGAEDDGGKLAIDFAEPLATVSLDEVRTRCLRADQQRFARRAQLALGLEFLTLFVCPRALFRVRLRVHRHGQGK